jgi:hypothetical protein
LLLDIGGEPAIFRIKARASASVPGAASAAWPVYRLEAEGDGAAWVLESPGEGFLAYRKTADDLSGLVLRGNPLDAAGLGEIQSGAAEGRAAEIEKSGMPFRYRQSSRMRLSDDGERYRFLFASAPLMLAVEAYAGRPYDFAVFEGCYLARIGSAWKAGR